MIWIGKREHARTVATLDDLADEVQRLSVERKEQEAAERSERLRGGPCAYCGLGVTLPGRGWRKAQEGPICGRCHRWFEDFGGNRENLCAAVLTGIATSTRRSAPRELAERTGLTLWKDSGRTEPNERPWQHLNVAQMRSHLAADARRGHYHLPARWDAEAVVEW